MALMLWCVPSAPIRPSTCNMEALNLESCTRHNSSGWTALAQQLEVSFGCCSPQSLTSLSPCFRHGSDRALAFHRATALSFLDALMAVAPRQVAAGYLAPALQHFAYLLSQGGRSASVAARSLPSLLKVPGRSSNRRRLTTTRTWSMLLPFRLLPCVPVALLVFQRVTS